MNVPSFGNICGYDFSLLASLSLADMPWLYAAPAPYMLVVERALNLDPWDGGRNLSGFSRTIDLSLGGGDDVEEACRV